MTSTSGTDRDRRQAPSSSFDATYRSLWPDLVRLGYLLAGSEAVGEELAQEAFIGLLGAREPVEHPAAYLRRSVVNLALTNRRRLTLERAYFTGRREEPAPPPDTDDVWPLLRRLPPRQRCVLVLRYYEDLSEAEIARVMGCPPGTVKSLASRGLTRLRQEVQP